MSRLTASFRRDRQPPPSVLCAKRDGRPSRREPLEQNCHNKFSSSDRTFAYVLDFTLSSSCLCVSKQGGCLIKINVDLNPCYGRTRPQWAAESVCFDSS